jgi:hypothetical protein
MTDPKNEWTDEDRKASIAKGRFLANVRDGGQGRLEYELCRRRRLKKRGCSCVRIEVRFSEKQKIADPEADKRAAQKEADRSTLENDKPDSKGTPI